MSRNSPRRIGRSLCEPLETRRMFITYQVEGTEGNDAISISIDGNNIVAVVNGVSDTGSDLINNNIEINAKGGSDTITIVETGANTVVVNAGNGNDTTNLASGDLDNIDDNVTVHGDAGTDTVSLNDQSETLARIYSVNLGNVVSRSGMPAATVNAESVVFRGGIAPNNEYQIGNAPALEVDVINGPSFGRVYFIGNGSQSITYLPRGTTAKSGTIDCGVHNVDFSAIDEVGASDLVTLTVITPNSFDALALAQDTLNLLSGSSGGVAMSRLEFLGVAALHVDMGLHDTADSVDNVSAHTGYVGGTRVDLTSGIGTNNLTVFSGAWTVDAGPGAATGDNLDVRLASGTSAITFTNQQSLRRLQIDNGGSASFVNSTGLINLVEQLAVTSGAGDLSVPSNTTVTVPAGAGNAFAIGAGRTLNKKGSGTLNINATQTHGTGAIFNADNGTTNFATDGGSAASRPLSVGAVGATVNFNTTQHLNLVSTGIGGLLRVGANGNRVLVCNSVFIDTEGSAIDLTNNDMIVDFANAADFSSVLQMLRNGRAGGAWSGIGITSATAAASPQHNVTLGILSATEYKSIYGAAATFDGQTLDNTAALIKFTYYGDADFNGAVDFDDYVRADLGFNSGQTGWLNGDFDLNGEVDFDDYVLIDLGFNTQGAPL